MEKNKKTLFSWDYFVTGFKISSKWVCKHFVTRIYFRIVLNEKFWDILLYFSSNSLWWQETNMTVAGMMTCKFGLVRSHTKTIYGNILIFAIKHKQNVLINRLAHYCISLGHVFLHAQTAEDVGDTRIWQQSFKQNKTRKTRPDLQTFLIIRWGPYWGGDVPDVISLHPNPLFRSW